MSDFVSRSTVLGPYPGPESCELCHTHGLKTELVRDPFVYGKGSDAVELTADVPVHSCSHCGESYTGEEGEIIQHETVCRHLGVLAPREIRALRKGYGMSRAAFAQVTGFGEASVARWERGEVIQNTSNDHLLRSLFDRRVLERLSRLAQYEDKLGREFSMVLVALTRDWASALMRYKEFRELFAGADNVKLLNAVGGGLFRDVQQISWSDLMLRLTRLTDPPRSAGRDNLTIQRLPDLCKDPELRHEVVGLMRKAIDAAGFARDWRNRLIGHADLDRAIDPRAKPLDSANLQKVKRALTAVHAVLNTVNVRLLGTTIENDVVIRPRARAFMAYLRQLAAAVRYIDSIIDPGGEAHFTNVEVARAFLKKLERSPTWQEEKEVVELREAARGFYEI